MPLIKPNTNDLIHLLQDDNSQLYFAKQDNAVVGLREFAEHVRSHTARQPGAKTPGDELEQAGQRLKRECIALDARGHEAVKQQQRRPRDRGNDYGIGR